jgi:hypothetical protein
MRARILLAIAVVMLGVTTLPRPTEADCTAKDNEPQGPSEPWTCSSDGMGGCDCDTGDSCSSGAMVSSGMMIFGSVAFVSRRRRRPAEKQQ